RRSRVRAGDGHPGSRWTDLVRGARPVAGTRGDESRRRRCGRGLAAVRRPGPGDIAARGQPHVRDRDAVRAGPERPRSGMTALVSAVALLLLALATPAVAAPVASITLEGVVSPVMVRLVETAIDRAQASGASALVIQLDTPGGLERSMRVICQRLLNAPLPVIVYVAPTGARAASAGVFITMAAHVAAMAPATNIGAAHPVALGGGVDKESMKKIENDAAAFARTIAVERGRNAEWAEKAVRQSVSITEREA